MDVHDDEAGQANFQARAYQLEMYEQSMEKNIIVAVSVAHGQYAGLTRLQMDTGSGKTQMYSTYLSMHDSNSLTL